MASIGDGGESFEIRYEDENIRLTQKMLAGIYGVDVRTVNYHIKKVFEDAELQEDSVIRNFRITAPDGKKYNVNHYGVHAESEFEKYRVIQDCEYLSDYDRYLLELEGRCKIKGTPDAPPQGESSAAACSDVGVCAVRKGISYLMFSVTYLQYVCQA